MQQNKKIRDNILDCIGNTPMLRLNKITESLPCTVLVKLETFNPGNSIKDRMAVKMIDDAEKEGKLKPGYTIIEGTSGNTGMGLAIAATVKGYKCIFTSTDKQSKEKFDALRALGAKVIVCPTAVEPEDPRSYYSVSSRLVKEIPNSWKPDQYANLSNRQAHYESTGPEIWDQTDGKITHLVAGVGTGGTISGCAKFLREKNPNVKIWAIDTYGSVFKKYKETGIFDKEEIYPYVTEGIGEDFLPDNVDFDLIDLFEKVTDKDAAIYTREIALQEGILAGNSAGAAIKGLLQLGGHLTKDDVVVVIFHDSGTRYLGKMFNDDWMRKMGYMPPQEMKTVSDLLEVSSKTMVSVVTGQTVEDAYQLLVKNNINQLPVCDARGEIVGSITDTILFSKLVEDPSRKLHPIESLMAVPFPSVSLDATIADVSFLMSKEASAVTVKDMSSNVRILTKYDVINALR